ncbi:Cysteine and histidine-rich domain-containing protein 1 [Nowakowskiella sp. JEL0078]|nr:Cysteine and histidine-rich domain-containing protein 1 [Nowakowskiella sp. JEL0078]
MTLLCTRRGCGKSFKDDENNEAACEFHSGGPVFHEGLKGWSCCSKRVIDFDEFLKIPGCSIGSHSTEAPTQIPLQKPTETAEIVPVKKVDGVEVYGTPTPVVAPAEPSQFIPKAVDSKPVIKEEDLHDAENAIIEIDSVCKRKGCGKKYLGPDSKTEECVFHAGEPVFHEGSKVRPFFQKIFKIFNRSNRDGPAVEGKF